MITRSIILSIDDSEVKKIAKLMSLLTKPVRNKKENEFTISMWSTVPEDPHFPTLDHSFDT